MDNLSKIIRILSGWSVFGPTFETGASLTRHRRAIPMDVNFDLSYINKWRYDIDGAVCYNWDWKCWI